MDFRTLKFIAYLIAIVSVLELWGVDAASIIAGLGLFSVALALGAQNFFKNLIGGLLIIGEKDLNKVTGSILKESLKEK